MLYFDFHSVILVDTWPSQRAHNETLRKYVILWFLWLGLIT